MGEKIIVGPINSGFRNDKTAFVIDNDSFPRLINAYQWRGRVKRKRGTALLTRLKRYFDSTSTTYNSGSSTITLNGSGVGNLISGFSLETNAAIVPGSITITAPGPTLYTDSAANGTLSPSGSINYATGVITIAAQAAAAVSATFNYYPALPVLGLRDFTVASSDFPLTIGFDTTYAYNIRPSDPQPNYSVSLYKNPGVSASLPSYVAKTTWTPTSWNGQDYQQFWTYNYQGVIWTTNGINVPFSIANIGMQYKAVTNVSAVAAGVPVGGTTANLTIASHGLVIGDFIYVNEVKGFATATDINYQTGYVTVVVDVNTVTVVFPNANIVGAYSSGGIAQYLTNRSDKTKDCLRWYDGDPTNGAVNAPVPSTGFGWVNFAPPIFSAAQSISDLPTAIYYLVGARTIVAFKDRLLFIGVVVQTSSAGSQKYLQDTIIYSQNGTPFYTSSFTGDPSLTSVTYNPILCPVDQTATANAYWSDLTGYGGFASPAVDEPINTVSINEDALILGSTNNQIRMIYSQNDIVPFEFYTINSEFGSSSTFSAINLDDGVISRGDKGYVMTSQSQCQRIDLDIPDLVFECSLVNNGKERITGQRDFINEWMYFSYPGNETAFKFPNVTLQLNYRDKSWGVFNECFTTYGQFHKTTGYTWDTIGDIFNTWNSWNEPWDAGSTTILQPMVIAGNAQGFVVIRDEGTAEAYSLQIKGISTNTITSPNHGLNDNDYIMIHKCLGTVDAQVNGKIFSVSVIDTDTFTLNPPITSATYLGNGTIKRLYIPFIQTKQFPLSWSIGRKTRLGVQQYLFSTTPEGKVQLLIFLSQNADSAYNDIATIPLHQFIDSGMIYNTTLYTCPESSNIGLTPFNSNLQMPTAIQQAQIWHRVNTSLIGDTVQVGITLSDEQMREISATDLQYTITGATKAYPCVLTTAAPLSADQLVQISDVAGMTELNGNTYSVISSSATTLTIDVDSSAFTTYVSGGTVTVMNLPNQFEEIELHSFILDCSPSQMLV